MIPKTIKEVRQILKDENEKRELERVKNIEVDFEDLKSKESI